MAEGGANPAKVNLVCRYFLHGVCSKGSSCRYIHDRSGTVPSDQVCRFYQLNQCAYGKRCKFQHVRREGRTRNDSTPTNRTASSGAIAESNPIDRRPQMVTLSKKGFDHSIQESRRKKTKDAEWAQAKVFIPGQMYHGGGPNSYAAAIGTGSNGTLVSTEAYGRDNNFMGIVDVVQEQNGGVLRELMTPDTPLCPFYAAGECQFDSCEYAHGDICDMCGMPQLHPLNKKQRRQHQKECLEEHEKEMEKAFAHQSSEDKECGICLESVMLKESGDRRFGILENCNHCFCLTCIRQWRGNKEESIETHRACPTCRTHSDFITPSKYWVETSEEKSQLITDYKRALKKKPCQYFKKGKGECPFNSSCFYKHALPDGTEVAENQVRRRRRQNGDSEYADVHEDWSLWDYIMARHHGGGEDDLEDEVSLLLMEIFQVSDDENNENTSNFSWLYDSDSDSSD